MNRRRFLQLSSGAIGYSLTPAASRAAVSSEEHSSKFVSPASPTALETAQVIDRIWQKASATYGPARAALLEEVDRRANDGPFRPDWESLATYRRQSGTRMQSLAFLFTGACIPSPRSATNGIPATCT